MGDTANKKIIVIDSIDGDEHIKSKKNVTSVISYSTMLVSPKWIENKTVSAGSSINIMTWQQVRGTESLKIMLPSVQEYYEEKKKVREDEKNKDHCFYDLHDGKML